MTGELIRAMNYIDDISTTLRRVKLSVASLDDEEKKKLAEYMKLADPQWSAILKSLG